ncbi:hypothetical protein [Phenylobacterium sp.]|uniref:hypothetical protein n=1 Tax=Phenylobacterium sp. TaxID=1871053 RepID=UPI00356719E2
MLAPQNYLMFANQADMLAETAIDSEMKKHFLHMAAQWRSLADYTEATEAFRPGGPLLA